MTEQIKKKRLTIHVPQLVGRVSYPQADQQLNGAVGPIAMRRLVSELDTAMAELQQFLKYLQNSSDVVITESGFDPDVPEILDGTVGVVGDTTTGWSPGRHRHQLRTGPANSLGNANAPGAGPAVSFNDHVHKRDVRIKIGGLDIGTRNALNFLGGSTAVDNVGTDSVDVTIIDSDARALALMAILGF